MWLEIPALHASRGAYLRAIRLIDFDGTAHRVPLGLVGGLTLANQIMRACSKDLLVDASKALIAFRELVAQNVRNVKRSGLLLVDPHVPR
ncbi:MAG TPA: hypothetical protein VGH28_14630 [Polyangiaceae bacterium]